MHPLTRLFPLLVLAAFLVSAHSPAPVLQQLAPRHGEDMHHHHGAPTVDINETEIAMHHAPTPPSYWYIDIADPDHNTRRYPGLIALHVAFVSLAFFAALPITIALRSVRSRWRNLTLLLFYALNAIGITASAIYAKLTPNMYEGSTHRTHAYMVLSAALLLHIIPPAARRLFALLKSRNLFRDDNTQYIGLVSKEIDDNEIYNDGHEPTPYEQPSTAFADREHEHDHDHDHDTERWANQVHFHTRHHRYSSSAASEPTVFSPSSDDTALDSIPMFRHTTTSRFRSIASAAHAITERVLVFAGFALALGGIAIYTGGCRQNYLNGCLAHLIKGGIFWCYGLVSFARFLGAFSELGWAWNRIPGGGNGPSAEFVESLVIFIYGVTNTWMERFGARPGDPFTTKQLQHIGIAVMFWFAGLIGMGIESKRVRAWLAAAATHAAISHTRSKSPSPSPSPLRQEEQQHVKLAEPPNYSASFNPFPALVIGVTGAAMAAHAQAYVFQVQIHALWGNLLLGFALLRSLTYFFLWLAPPRSVLPSRPPTEALGSFFLACGGLVFIMSTEEVTLAAMRQGRDDVMMFLNVAVAITCFAFCWTLGVVAFKGYLKSRLPITGPSIAYQNHQHHHHHHHQHHHSAA